MRVAHVRPSASSTHTARGGTEEASRGQIPGRLGSSRARRAGDVQIDVSDGAQADLDGSGLPFGTADFLTQFGSNAPLLDPEITVIPEPSSALLIGLGLAALSIRTRRT